MKELLARELFDLIYEVNKNSSTLILLIFLVVTLVIVLDSLYEHSKRKNKQVGLDTKSQTIGVDGLKNLPTLTYVSDIQGLAGRPDAVIREKNFIIPVERKPLAKKIRDRYVAQLLVYMRLIEEFEGKKPPYGYLILGAKCKRVKIYNTPEKQAWLQKMLDEMKSIICGNPAKALPEYQKCKKCSVKKHCNFTYVPAVNSAATSKTKLKILH
jgi:CRISPR/Cas system-associated exonuclease Cas4 (RecB family)